MSRQTEGALTVAGLYCLLAGISGACILERPYIQYKPRDEPYFAHREVWPTATYMGLGTTAFITLFEAGTRLANRRVRAENPGRREQQIPIVA